MKKIQEKAHFKPDVYIVAYRKYNFLVRKPKNFGIPMLVGLGPGRKKTFIPEKYTCA